MLLTLPLWRRHHKKAQKGPEGHEQRYNRYVFFFLFIKSWSREGRTDLRYTLEVGNAGNRWNGGDGWKDERTDGRTKGTDGWKDGTYGAGVKDSASAYVLCPRLTEQLCLSIWKGIGNCGKGLRRISRWELEGVQKDGTMGLDLN